MDTPPKRRVIARKDAVELLGVSYATFHRLAAAGDIERKVLPGRHDAFYYLDTVQKVKALREADPNEFPDVPDVVIGGDQ